MMKSGFWTLIFSFCPGAGQMYQGYMKRGLSLVLYFVLPMMVGGAFLPVLMGLSLVAYMYSFFDSLNLRSQLRQGLVPPDEFLLFGGEGADVEKLLRGRYHLLGWALVALGAYGLYQNFLRPWLWSLVELFGVDSPASRALVEAMNALPGLAMALALILLGLWLIRGGKNKQPPAPDYTEYKGEEG